MPAMSPLRGITRLIIRLRPVALVCAAVDLDGRFLVAGRYLVDAISSASVDVVTAATGRFRELRHEATGGVTYHDGERSIGGAYVLSTEHDWTSHTGSVALAQDFAQHNL